MISDRANASWVSTQQPPALVSVLQVAVKICHLLSAIGGERQSWRSFDPSSISIGSSPHDPQNSDHEKNPLFMPSTR